MYIVKGRGIQLKPGTVPKYSPTYATKDKLAAARVLTRLTANLRSPKLLSITEVVTENHE